MPSSAEVSGAVARWPFYLIVLLVTISFTIGLCTSVPMRTVLDALWILLLWIVPWLLFFIALRLSGVHARGIFVSYILAMLLMILASTFYHSGKSTATLFDFFMVTPVLAGLYALALIAFSIAALRASRRLRHAV